MLNGRASVPARSTAMAMSTWACACLHERRGAGSCVHHVRASSCRLERACVRVSAEYWARASVRCSAWGRLKQPPPPLLAGASATTRGPAPDAHAEATHHFPPRGMPGLGAAAQHPQGAARQQAWRKRALQHAAALAVLRREHARRVGLMRASQDPEVDAVRGE